MSDLERDPSSQESSEDDASNGAENGASNDAAIVGERLTGEQDPRDPDGLITVDQVAGGSHGASPEEGLELPRDGRIAPTDDAD